MLRSTLVSELLLDLRHIARSFAKTPAVFTVAVLSLAVGIGANAALFSVADAVLFAPLPYQDSDRVVRLWETFQSSGGQTWQGSVSTPNLEDWRSRSKSFDGLGGYNDASVNLTSGGEPLRANAMRVDGAVFAILGVTPAMGRYLTTEDMTGDGRVVVLSDALWRSRYGGNEDLVGGTIDIGGAAHEVVGVMPPEFDFPPRSETDLWQPLQATAQQTASRGSHWMAVVGRLADGKTLDGAQAEMDSVGARLAEEYPDSQERRGVLIKTLRDTQVGDARPVLFALWGAVGFVLLIACGNVAHLLLARAARRQQELAVRAALGAGRGRLATSVLLEAAVLAGAGGLVGLVIGRLALDRLAQLPGSALPEGSVTLDGRVFSYALLAGLVAALVAGAVPAWRVARTDLRDALGSARNALGRSDRLRGLLVVAEVALALVVTLGAALLVSSLVRLTRVDAGLDAANVLTLRVPVPDDRYDDAGLRDVYRRIEERVTALPGVEAAGSINLLPLQDWGFNGTVTVEGKAPASAENDVWVEFRVASAGYFRALRIPQRSGRLFEASDDAENPGVVVINETMARTYWGTDDPIGARVAFGGTPENDEDWLRVIGVVGDVRNAGLHRAPRPELYVSPRQQALPEASLVVRTRGEPAALAGAVRQAILAVDPLQPVYRVQPMEEVLAGNVARRSFDTTLLTTFAALALLLAVTGVFSVMSHDISLRRSEIGLRMALGADRHRVVRHFLARGTLLALLGTGVGVVLALGTTRLLQNRLYGVEATDPATFGAGAATLVLLAASACLLPALRAASVEPTVALRED